MPRLKHVKGAEEAVAAHPFVIPKERQIPGGWAGLFGNDDPLFLEIGCGKGRFLLRQLSRRSDRDYIGIEMYSSVLLRGLETVDELLAAGEAEKLDHIRFIRRNAVELDQIFAPGEVEGIWLNFSDPWPKERHAKRRLTHRRFLRLYERVLAPGGTVEMKTDNPDLYAFTLEEAEDCGWEILFKTEDLYAEKELLEDNIATEYEEKFTAEGKPIHKIVMRPGRTPAADEPQDI